MMSLYNNDLKLNTSVKTDEADAIYCPRCGGFNLHQRSVTSTFRDDEDEDGTEVRHKRLDVEIKRRKDKDIVGRRDVLHIDFQCEECSYYNDENEPQDMLTLAITQHKGSTYIEWLPWEN